MKKIFAIFQWFPRKANDVCTGPVESTNLLCIISIILSALMGACIIAELLLYKIPRQDVMIINIPPVAFLIAFNAAESIMACSTANDALKRSLMIALGIIVGFIIGAALSAFVMLVIAILLLMLGISLISLFSPDNKGKYYISSDGKKLKKETGLLGDVSMVDRDGRRYRPSGSGNVGDTLEPY